MVYKMVCLLMWGKSFGKMNVLNKRNVNKESCLFLVLLKFLMFLCILLFVFMKNNFVMNVVMKLLL